MSESRIEIRRGLLEVVAIVGSILLAFAIDAAWDARQEAREEQELLVSLEAEFDFQRSELVRHMERWEVIRGATARLLEATGSGVVPSPVAMDSLLQSFLIPPTFDPRKGTLSAATASGSLGLVANRELRNSLAAWDGVVDEVRDNEIAGRDFIGSTIIPYLARRGVPVARAWALSRGFGLTETLAEPQRWPGPLASDAEAERMYEALIADPEFEVLAAHRYRLINVGEYADAVDFVDELLALLATEIRLR